VKDFIGQELVVGDVVVTTPKNYRGLIKAKVVAFTPQKVRVGYRWQGHDVDYLAENTAVVRVGAPTVGRPVWYP